MKKYRDVSADLAARREIHRARAGANPGTSLFYRLGEVEEANALVIKHHYSKRPPANVQLVATAHKEGGLFGVAGDCVAACFFSIPPTRWSVTVLELTRLVRIDQHIQLSSLVSWASSRALKMEPIVVSFADCTQGHHGGIYQSCGWNYHGKRDRGMDGVVMDGEFYPGRTCNSIFGTQSIAKLRSMFPRKQIEPHFDHGKHLYWKCAGKEGERRANVLGLLKNKYPKPNMEACQ